MLVDSGAQYLSGTTDITRTIALGSVPDQACAPYTAVLRGMIALSRARFPRGVGGAHLDALARQFLWQQGLDYDHGTGHGVGAALCVHEGPVRISRASTLPLEPGMILSNEPGYYREGAFGIRIENLLAVTEAEAEPGRNGPGLRRSGGDYALTAETSISRTTLSETMTPEFSGACQSTPNSLRLMEPVAVRPMRSRS